MAISLRTGFLLAVLVSMWAGATLADDAAFNVRNYGAKGDKKASDQAAIQAAVDACAKAGGGDVVLSAGDYLSGTVRLASGVTLRLEHRA